MAINSKHPTYERCITDWTLMRDAYEGERVVKAKGTEYLPATAGQVLDGMDKSTDTGYEDYQAYKLRAVFPDFVSQAVENYMGMLHEKDATIELPDAMMGLMEHATIDGESLPNLLRRINEQQLVPGRLGLMLEWPNNLDATKPSLPYIAMYYGETVINWDNSDDNEGVNALNLVVLDETADVRQADYTWKREERYRILELRSPSEVVKPNANAAGDGETGGDPDSTKPDDVTETDGSRVYMQGEFEMRNGGGSVDPSAFIVPMYKGQAFDQIPFVFINSKDIIAMPDNPPLLGLGRTCMTIYRGEADYRQSLHQQGQDTLVVIGGLVAANKDDTTRVGAGSKIEVDIGGDAKYIGVSSLGLEEQRTCLENDRKEAESKAGTLISPSAGKQESGDALSTRLSAQTASLKQIAASGAAGLENILKMAAVWMGQDPKKVRVSPNLDFQPVLLTGQEVTQYMAARTMGAPLALKSLHNVFVARGLTNMTFEEELEQIGEEDLERAKLVATLPQPPAPPAPEPAPGQKKKPVDA